MRRAMAYPQTTIARLGPGDSFYGCCQRRLEAFALQTLAFHLPGAANGLGLLARLALGRLFIGTAQFHFPEDTFALKLLLERFERLIDVVIANGYMHGRHFSKELKSVRERVLTHEIGGGKCWHRIFSQNLAKILARRTPAGLKCHNLRVRPLAL